MKLHLENLGRIKQAEIEIKPLTVFLGKNNTGKTWAASALFGILQGLRARDPFADPSFEDDEAFSSGVARFAARLRADRAKLLPRTGEMRPLNDDEVITADGHEPLSFGIAARTLGELVGETVEASAHAKLALPRSQFRRETTRGVLLIGANEPAFQLRRGDEPWNREVTDSALEKELADVFRVRFNRVRYLPAERNGIMPLAPLFVRDASLDPRRSIQDFCVTAGLAMSKAHSGAMPFVAGVSAVGRGQVTDLASLGVMTLRSRLHDIVGGHYEYGDGRPIRFVVRDGPSLAMAAWSSLVKSLFALEIYLADASSGDVLLIDEPEMNAHPEAQAQTAELLAMMANAGITVVVTTHSPYLVDHFSNLISGNKVPSTKRKSLARALYLGDESALIDVDKVAAYEFKETKKRDEVRVEPILDRKRGRIDWSSFGAVSDDVSNLYGHVLELRRKPAG
jgi:hypothetical protein